MAYSLVQVAQDELALMELIQEAEGELTPQLEEWLNEVEKNIAVKTDHYQFVLDRLEANSEALDKRSKELRAAAVALQSVKENINGRIKHAMQTMGTNEIKGESFRFKLSSAAPRVVVDNEAAIPLTFKREETIWTADKKAIKESFDLGVPVEGCHIEQGATLRTYVNKESK